MSDQEIEKQMIECTALGEIIYDSVESLCQTYESKGIGMTGGVMMIIWELITTQLLKSGIKGNKLRVVLMELQDDHEE